MKILSSTLSHVLPNLFALLSVEHKVLSILSSQKASKVVHRTSTIRLYFFSACHCLFPFFKTSSWMRKSTFYHDYPFKSSCLLTIHSKLPTTHVTFLCAVCFLMCMCVWVLRGIVCHQCLEHNSLLSMNCILAGTWNTWPHLSELKLKELNKLSQKGKPGPLTDVLSSMSLPGVSLCLGSVHCGKCSVYLLYSSLTSVLPPKIVLGSVVQHDVLLRLYLQIDISRTAAVFVWFFWCWLLIFYFISHCIHDTFWWEVPVMWRGMFLYV